MPDARIKGQRNSILNKVEYYLRNNPDLRDNDTRLLAYVWWGTLGIRYGDSRDIKVSLFFKLLSDGKIPNFESIRRCRQKLQEENSELRGKLWEKRHKAEKAVKDEIQNWDEPERQGSFI